MYKNTMVATMGYAQEEPAKAAIYTFLSGEPTMTNSRVEAMGTGSQPAYIKIATGFANEEAS